MEARTQETPALHQMQRWGEAVAQHGVCWDAKEVGLPPAPRPLISYEPSPQPANSDHFSTQDETFDPEAGSSDEDAAPGGSRQPGTSDAGGSFVQRSLYPRLPAGEGNGGCTPPSVLDRPASSQRCTPRPVTSSSPSQQGPATTVIQRERPARMWSSCWRTTCRRRLCRGCWQPRAQLRGPGSGGAALTDA